MCSDSVTSCGVVLAGGRSSRMGSDKALLQLPDGCSFLKRALGLMGELPLAQVVFSGARFGGIADPVPGMGPLGGLYGVANAVQAQALLVIPVDMPLLRCDQLALLLQEGERSRRTCYYAGHHFPLWLPLSAEVRGFLHGAMYRGGIRSIGALLRCAGARQLPVPEPEYSFDNINTPAEYAAYYPQNPQIVI